MSDKVITIVTSASGEWILQSGKFPRMEIRAIITFATFREIRTFDNEAICKGLEELFTRAATFAPPKPQDTLSAGRRDEKTKRTNQRTNNDNR